jgi:hypothetical protein
MCPENSGSDKYAGTKRKMKEYERAYNMQRTDRSSIFFFAVETSGGLGKEAREFVKLLAKMSGGDLSSTILRIYQTLAVKFQTARAEQIYITNRRYVTNTPPLPPSSFIHPIPPIVHPPLPSPPPPPLSSTSILSSVTCW